jgi:predicted nucleotidyltransferase
MLAQNIQNYIDQLIEKSPEITDVWLIGSRANGNATACSDWDFLVFGCANTFDVVKNDKSLHCPEIDLLVVIGGEFSKPYGDSKIGSLHEWEWSVESELEATYKGVKWVTTIETGSEDASSMGYMIEQKLKAKKVY